MRFSSPLSPRPALERVALGETNGLGSLYDATTDTFVPMTFLKSPPPSDAIKSTAIHDFQTKYIVNDSLKAKLGGLDVSAQLGASILAGLSTVEGSGQFLLDYGDTNQVAQRSLVYSIRTVNEKLDFDAKSMVNIIPTETTYVGPATHIVSEIIWGSRTIITAKQSLLDTDDARVVNAMLDARLQPWRSWHTSKPEENSDIETSLKSDTSFEIIVYSDVLTTEVDLTSVNDLAEDMQNITTLHGDGKGVPLVYKLVPLSTLSVSLSRNPLFIQDQEEGAFGAFVKAFNDLGLAQKNLHDYHVFCQKYSAYIPANYADKLSDRSRILEETEATLRRGYADCLKAVRTGSAGKNDLWNLYDLAGTDQIYKFPVGVPAAVKQRAIFIDGLVNRGAKYVGYNGESLGMEIRTDRHKDFHVLHFSNAASDYDKARWAKNLTIIQQLLDNPTPMHCVILLDHDAFDSHISATGIEVIRNAEVMIQDVLDEQKLFTRCFAQPDDIYLQRGKPKPVGRITMRISCPKDICALADGNDNEWICTRCFGLIEYGYSDNILYCDCGGCEYKDWKFLCSNVQHGVAPLHYDASILLPHLKALEPVEELNILILGATGVGKSTWVNAFVNYLMFPTLDEALDEQKLHWVIPFAFNTHDKKEDGNFEKLKISFGFGDQSADNVAQNISVEEHDGTKGESATQNATVHRVQIGKQLIRLIDTPGIGDTRGAAQDKENLADILRVVRTYSKLHGILILLKPNEQRLGVMFRFCIQELLTHLHRDAARNIAFGFTNTRSSSYTPGDTFDPLEALLGNHKDVEIKLQQRNVYCFDSESFRYLAAVKQHNRSLGNVEESKSSWEYSVKESKRLLDHFKAIHPHHVDSTVNLYETRRRILQMTEPMAAIAEAMKNSIKVNEDAIEQLKQHNLTKAELEQQLKRQVISLQAVPVSLPRTACSDASCVEYTNTGLFGSDGRPTFGTIYRSICHKPCYLQGIPVDNIGDSALRGCWAMNGGDTCRICGHPWNMHLHIKYRYQNQMVEIEDPTIAAALESNATLCTTQEAIIASKKNLVEELELELNAMVDAAAHFSIFLARNAIMPINDATLAYLDQQLEQEQGKIQAGGSRDKYKLLTDYRRQYEQEVAILKEYMEKGESHKLLDQAGVENLVQQLYALRHYGAQIRQVHGVLDRTQVQTTREKAHIVRAGGHWNDEPKKLKLRRVTVVNHEDGWTTRLNRLTKYLPWKY